MKEKLTKLTAILLLATFVVFGISCKDDVAEESRPDRIPVKLSAGIKPRAVDATWHQGDCIGLSLFETGTTNFIENQHNHQYSTRSGDGIFDADGTNIVYYPLDGSVVDIRGYYPYRGDLGEDCLCAVDVNDQTDLAAINLMTFDTYTGASRNNPSVTVTFKHRLTKLIFNLRREDNQLMGIKHITIGGMKTKGEFCLFKEKLTIDSNSEKDLHVPVGEERTQAIVMPREAGEGVTFSITAEDDVVYTVKLDPEQELKAGYKYTFNVLLRGGETAPVIRGIIQDWTDGGSIDIESRPVTINTEPGGPGVSIGFAENDILKLYWEDLEVVTYTYDGTEWVPDTPVYWENIGDGTSETVKLRAEYVRSAALNDSQLPEVFLSETTCTRYGSVGLNFELVPSKVVFELKSEGDPAEVFTPEELETATIALPDYLKGYTLANGTFTTDGTKGNIEVMDRTALIIPQTKTNDLAIITLNGNSYKISRTEGQEFLAGKVYTVTVNMLKSQLNPAFNLTITDWADGGGVDNESNLVMINPGPSGPGVSIGFTKGEVISLYWEDQEVVKYIYNGTKWIPDAPVYWENVGDGISETVKLRAEYVRTTALNGTQLPEVFLSEVTTRRYGSVTLNFELVPAKIIYKLKSEGGSTDVFTSKELETATIIMPDYQRGYMLANGIFTTNGTKGNIEVTNRTALIIPQTKNNELAHITLKGNTYKISRTEAQEFLAGKVYTITVNILKSQLNPAFNLSYTDWVDDDNPIEVDGKPVNFAVSGETKDFKENNKFTLYLDGQSEPIDTYIYKNGKWVGKEIYWEEVGDGVSPTVTFRAEFKRNEKLDNEQMDEIFTAEAVCKRFGLVELDFKLVPAKIRIVLTSESDTESDKKFAIDDLKAASVSLIQYKNGGNVTYGVYTSGTTTVDIPAISSGINQTYKEALIEPQKKNGILAVVTLNGNKYNIERSTELDFQAGKVYTITVNMLKSSITPSFKIGYTDWENAPDIPALTATPVKLNVSAGTTTEFAIGNEIKLYDVANDEYLTTYKYAGSNTWNIATGEPALYWENIGDGFSDKVQLRAEFTRTDKLNDTQLPELFLASTKCDRFGNLNLQFGLVPAKVSFVLKSETTNPDLRFSKTDLDDATIVLPDFENAYTLEKGVFTQLTGTGKINVAANRTALIIPQTKTGDIAIIHIKGVDYKIADASGIKFEEGKHTEITVNITKTNVTTFSASYTDWYKVPGVEYEAFKIVTGGNTDSFKPGDELSLYYHNNNTGSKEFIATFQYNGSNEWINADNTSSKHYWQNLNHQDLYNFYAVSTLANNAPDNSNQMADVMYAEHTGVSKLGAINLSFAKKTAKINVVLTSNPKNEGDKNLFSKTDLESATITLPDYQIGAKYNGITYDGNRPATGTITANKISDTDNKPTWTALFEPQTINANKILIRININGVDYELKKSDATEFEVAKQYTYTINLTKTGISFRASYTPWTNINGGGGDIGLN